ncbi:MAG: quinol:cytochrome C oxidoreductase [Flavobacteriales bacterium]|nr:quinol:cytochrome C oxidoreductase [Flavobacteriales bacterium]
MFKITNRLKNIAKILMIIGFVSICFSIFNSTQNQYTDLEIHENLIEIVNKDFSSIYNNLNVDSIYPAKDTADIFSKQAGRTDLRYMAASKLKLDTSILNAIIDTAESSMHFHLKNKEIKSISSLYELEKKLRKFYHTKLSKPWTSLLFNNYFFLGISIFAVFFIALQYVSEAAWSIVIKRIPEAVLSFLPYTGIMMLVIAVAGALHWHHIYHWMAEGVIDQTYSIGVYKPYDKIIDGKSAFLDVTFFLIRSLIYVVGWIYFARKLKSLSLTEDLNGGINYYNKSIKTSAWFIVFFAVTSSVASWDWIMSIDSHWFSTIFGWFIFAEWAAIGFTTILLITLYLKSQGYLKYVNNSHIHDLGKWVFAFSLVWTYTWFCQYMLIWYSNIPEEVAYYTARLEVDNYRFLFWFSMLISFILPLILLMSAPSKTNHKRLIFVSIVILIGHWLNSYLLVAPGSLNTHGNIGWTEIATGLGFVGAFIYIVFQSLSKVPLETKNHPYLDESKNLHSYPHEDSH